MNNNKHSAKLINNQYFTKIVTTQTIVGLEFGNSM